MHLTRVKEITQHNDIVLFIYYICVSLHLYLLFTIYITSCSRARIVLASVVVSENNETRFIHNYGTLVFSYILLTKLHSLIGTV